MNLTRILSDTLLLIAVFLLPWWFVIPISLILAFFFKFYFEAVLAALSFDLIYAPNQFLFGVYYVTLAVLILFIGIEIIKRKAIWNYR